MMTVHVMNVVIIYADTPTFTAADHCGARLPVVVREWPVRPFLLRGHARRCVRSGQLRRFTDGVLQLLL